MAITLRPVTDQDAERLLAWRNDPVTRAHSRRGHILTWEELIAVPAGIRRETFVALSDGDPVGSVRLDYAGAECELSWTVAPEKRGRGLGRAIVAAAIAAAQADKLVAAIKPDNPASRRIAESLGFIESEHRDGLEFWRRDRL